MNVSVKSASPEFLENISLGPHGLQADEPVSAGGQDAAPNPYELLLAALGACTFAYERLSSIPCSRTLELGQAANIASSRNAALQAVRFLGS
jgi:hypothetical protein